MRLQFTFQKSILLVTSIFLMLSGCCTKKYCGGVESISSIELKNFSLSDVDSISVERFYKASDFSSRVDSVFVRAVPGSYAPDFYKIELTEKLQLNLEYRITFHSIEMRKTYLLTDFMTSKRTCNKCFPPFVTDKFNQLIQYKVNGQVMPGSIIFITK